MKNVKKAFRLFGWILIIMLALSGLGIAIHNKERYRDKEVTIELVEKKEDEESEEKE